MAEAFLEAAGSAAELIRRPAVAEAWDKPSALSKMTVGALAAHLANQVINTRDVLAAGESKAGPIPLLRHYERAAWVGADLDDDVNVSIRTGAAQVAGDGHDGLVARLDAALADVERMLGSAPPAAVAVPWQGWTLSLEDYLVTRMMEITVHSDDLAASVGLETPDLPETVLAPVLALLVNLSLRKHGQAAVVRTLTRSERAPGDITAF